MLQSLEERMEKMTDEDDRTHCTTIKNHAEVGGHRIETKYVYKIKALTEKEIEKFYIRFVIHWNFNQNVYIFLTR